MRAIYLKREYSPFPRLRDSKCSSNRESKSSMVKVYISFQMSRSKIDLGRPSRIFVCIPLTISSLVFSGTGCTANPTWGDIFESYFKSSKLKARTSLFTETWQKRRWSVTLLKALSKAQSSKLEPQVGLAVHYSPFPRRWDSKWSLEYKQKSSMVVPGLFLNGSFEKRYKLWPSRISICVSTSISSLIFSGTGCTSAMGWLRLVGCFKTYVSLQNIGLFCRALLH